MIEKEQGVLMAEEAGRTPSLAASLLVFGIMIGLVFVTVFLFGDEVAEGPLQVSVTLASLFALGVAYFYGYRFAVISEAIRHSVNEALGVIFIILAIGAVIGGLYLAGTVAAFVYYGVALISPRIFYVTVFVLTSLLSILTGSSFTTIGAVGVAFVGLASLMPYSGVSPAVKAGAAVSGAFLGDKTAKISDTFVLTTAVIGTDPDDHARLVWRTAIPAWLISALLFIILGFTGAAPETPVNPDDVQAIIRQAFNISPLAFLPVVVIFILSARRVSGFLSLMIAALTAIVLATFTQPALVTDLVAAPDLPYIGAVAKVGIDTIAHGFQLNSGIPEMDQLFSGGGTFAMFETLWLILIAASFGAIAGYTGMIQRIMAPVIRWADSSFRLLAITILTTMGLNILTADSYVAILLGGRMFRERYKEKQLKPAVLSGAIADSGSIFSPIIPWNVHGAFVGGALGIGVLAFAPYAFLCYLSPLVTLVLGALRLRQDKLPDDTDADAVYGEEPHALPPPQLSA